MSTPAILGEADVLKSLQILPGVQQGMSGTNAISVRGGSSDQNLYLLDGVMLYNVNHFLGMASAFMPEATKHIDFYSASFPARYGGEKYGRTAGKPRRTATCRISMDCSPSVCSRLTSRSRVR